MAKLQIITKLPPWLGAKGDILKLSCGGWGWPTLFKNCILWQTLNKTIKYIDKASFAYRHECCRKSGGKRKWENKPQYLQGLRDCPSKLHIYTSGHSILHQLHPQGTSQPPPVIWKAVTSAPPRFFLPLWLSLCVSSPVFPSLSVSFFASLW